MKNIWIILTSILLLVPFCAISFVQATPVLYHTSDYAPGDIITVSSDPYPTLSEPSLIIVIVHGKAAEPFNETLVITDEFQGLVDTSDGMTRLSGTVTELSKIITIGRLPQYTIQITWYPTVVGNHSFHITAGSFPERYVNISVSFDVDGIITPSFGHPCIISKDTTNELQVTVSETRACTHPPSQIVSASLQPINGSSSYPLETQLAINQYMIATGSDFLQDELIVTYDISNIPNGFYDLSMRTSKQNYTWPHAVKIQDSEPTDYTVVQLTDVHVGKYFNIINEKKMLAGLITYINENIHPDFVILSGDSVDWFNEKYKRNAFNELKNVLLACDVPIFTTPGIMSGTVMASFSSIILLRILPGIIGSSIH